MNFCAPQTLLFSIVKCLNVCSKQFDLPKNVHVHVLSATTQFAIMPMYEG